MNMNRLADALMTNQVLRRFGPTRVNRSQLVERVAFHCGHHPSIEELQLVVSKPSILYHGENLCLDIVQLSIVVLLESCIEMWLDRALESIRRGNPTIAQTNDTS